MTPQIVMAVVAVFVAVALVVGGVTSWWLSYSAPEQRRLRELQTSKATVLQINRAGLPGGLTESLDPMLAKLSKLMPKSPKDTSRLQRRLTQAGFPQASAAVYYSIAEMALPVVLGLTVLLALGVASGWLFAALAAVLGYVAPSFYVGRKTTLRQKAIRNGLPDALDLLTLCTEAGSGLDQALAKTSDELFTAHPALAEELRMITTEIRAGKPRMEAFRNFASRTGVDDVKSLVAMLTQTDRFGTSVADALRIQSDTSRTKRRQFAEERAGKVGVKLVFPLVLCLFPALYIVCFGPVVVKMFRAFAGGQL
jgi:tight adherence protein C